MEVMPLESSGGSLLAYMVAAIGVGMAGIAVLVVVGVVYGPNHANTGPVRAILGAVVLSACGAGMIWSTYRAHAVHAIAWAPDAIELRYHWPRPPIRLESARVQSLDVSVGCEWVRRSGYRPVYSLSIGLADGRFVDHLPGHGDALLSLARRFAVLTGVQPVIRPVASYFRHRCGV